MTDPKTPEGRSQLRAMLTFGGQCTNVDAYFSFCGMAVAALPPALDRIDALERAITDLAPSIMFGNRIEIDAVRLERATRIGAQRAPECVEMMKALLFALDEIRAQETTAREGAAKARAEIDQLRRQLADSPHPALPHRRHWWRRR